MKKFDAINAKLWYKFPSGHNNKKFDKIQGFF